MTPYLAALICVLGTAGGQLLFKSSAQALGHVGGQGRSALTLLAAFGLYGLTTLLWIWVLTKVELNRVYPLMALSFALVPAANLLIFKTPLGSTYLLGCGLVLIGVVLILRTSSGS
jgi:drug/metabolite transporter (DMT)-like permease